MCRAGTLLALKIYLGISAWAAEQCVGLVIDWVAFQAGPWRGCVDLGGLSYAKT